MYDSTPLWQDKKRNYEQREPLYWEDLYLGREWGPVIFSITKELVQSVIEITRDDNPLYWDEKIGKESPYGTVIAPQAVAVIFGRLGFLGERYRPGTGGAVTGMSCKFIQPAKVGDTITSRAVITSKEESKGRRRFTVHIESVNSENEPVLIMDLSAVAALRG
jgi:acyl dehydratase